MIAEYIKKPALTNRGHAKNLIPYIFGANKDCKQTDPKHVHTGIKEKIHFIGCSDNICISDPLYKVKNGKVVKIDGAEADLSEIIETFNESESKNERAKFPLEHIVLSLSPGESLTIAEWLEAVQMYINDMGYENCTWASTLHEDTENAIHAHIALNNISNKSPHNSVNPSNKFQLSTAARTNIEQKFNLSHTVNPFEDKIQIKNPKLQKNQIKNYVRVSIDEIMDANPDITLPRFQLEMQKKDIGTFASLKSHETQIQGLSFSYIGTKMKASQLGVGYKTKDLIGRGLNYDIYRDLEQVTELNDIEKERCEMIKTIANEAEEIANKLIDERSEMSKCTTTFKSESNELMKAMQKFNDDYYVVSMMSKDDIKKTFENKQTGLFSTFTDCIINAEYDSVNKLCAVEFDPFDKNGERARRRLSQAQLNLIRAKNKKAQKKLLAVFLKMLMMRMSSAKPSCYKENHILPKRGYDLGPLNYRFDKSPVTILSKREIALIVLSNKTIRIKNRMERYVTLNDNNKILFVNRNRDRSIYASYENGLNYTP